MFGGIKLNARGLGAFSVKCRISLSLVENKAEYRRIAVREGTQKETEAEINSSFDKDIYIHGSHFYSLCSTANAIPKQSSSQ
jgi:hypothetical protein